jgi:DNA polymerase III alpha subunit
VRQRPGSAKGVVFLTLEDEFSVCNAVIWPQVLETHRAVVMGARLMLIRGRVQRTGDIIHVVAADRIFLELSKENGLDDKQRFFLSTLLQKRHLLAGYTRWPTPAKISSKQAQLAEPENKEGSGNEGAASEANPQSPSMTPAATSLPGW